MLVPAGATRIGIARGFEYVPIIETVDVQSDTAITFRLHRRAAMSQQHWYSGDCHTHAAHSPNEYVVLPEDALLMATAEGLNVINCLDNTYHFTGGPDPCSTDDCVVCFSEEHRSNRWGHSDCLGLTELVGYYNISWYPLIWDIADLVHQQPGALIIPAHPITLVGDFFSLEPVAGHMYARELPVDAYGGKLDAFEAMSGDRNFMPRNLDVWYHLLNCGFRLPAAAGTDAVMSQSRGIAPGAYQVYVQIPAAEGFGYWSWLGNLAKGRTFVTNGPLVPDFQVEGCAAGDSLAFAGVESVELAGQFSVVSAWPLKRADVIVNGAVDQSLFFGPGQTQMETEFTVTLSRSSWVAVRVLGRRHAADWATAGDSLRAQTSPVYVRLNGQRAVETASAEFFVDWMEDLTTLADTAGVWEDPSDSVRVFGLLNAARLFYQNLANGSVTGLPDPPQDSIGLAALYPNRPNPFSVSTAIQFTLAKRGAVNLDIHDLSGRRVCRVVAAELEPGLHSIDWDGTDQQGSRVASGVYFCRLDGEGFSICEKTVLLR